MRQQQPPWDDVAVPDVDDHAGVLVEKVALDDVEVVAISAFLVSSQAAGPDSQDHRAHGQDHSGCGG